MKKKSQSRLLVKTGATALALCCIAGNCAAATLCARPDEMDALRVSALRQNIMVAAIMCREADAFNRFVISYRDDFIASDHTLMGYFVRQGDSAGYDSYKTRLANAASMRGQRDPEFCGSAQAAMYAALSRSLPLAQVASEHIGVYETGIAQCTADTASSPPSLTEGPNFPSQHRDTLGTAPPIPNDPVMAANTPNAPGEPQDVDDTPIPAAARNVDYAPNSEIAYVRNAQGTYDPQVQQYLGPDGRWYLYTPAR